MKTIHKKSKCCGAKIIRFGGKRRQCTSCKKTWRVHQSRRGRKPTRPQYDYLEKVFNHGFKVKQLSLSSGLPVDTVYKRFSQSLEAVANQERIIDVEGEKLILMIDAEWHYFQKKLWTLYLLAVKPVGSESVTILDPILRQGKESAEAWREIFEQLPPPIKSRVIALVSDGIRGIEAVAGNNNWILQRCHFHLLKQLQNRRGKRASTPGRFVREEIYNSVKLALSETSPPRLNILCNRLAVLAEDKNCPKRMRMIVRDFLRKLPEFRSYLNYPESNLPITVNVMESLNSFIRQKSKTANTPRSWHKWAIACARLKSKFTCK